MASYATLANFAVYAVNPAAFAGIPDGTKQAQLDAASTLGEGYLAAQYHLPIVAPYPVDLVMAVCSVAAFTLMSFRGYKPDVQGDATLLLRYDHAIAWFKGVATGMISPAGIIDSAPDVREGAPTVTTGAGGNVVGGYGLPSTVVGGTGRRGW